jgi:HSP20 family protein
MSLVRWDPFKNMATLQDRINRLFDDAFPRSAGGDEDLSASAWHPLVDIFETDQGVSILVDLPGVNKEDVSVEVKENVLTIQGERRPDQEVADDRYFRRERAFGVFQRSFATQTLISPGDIKATFKNGVLKIQVPKPQEVKPKQVSVNID